MVREHQSLASKRRLVHPEEPDTSLWELAPQSATPESCQVSSAGCYSFLLMCTHAS